MKRMLLIFIIIMFVNPLHILASDRSLPSDKPLSEVEESVEALMNQYVGKEKDIPGAAIVIIQDGQVVLEKGYGFSDIKRNQEVNPKQTIFEAASISKVYTWSAVMQLVEEGMIDLDTDIKEYLPNNYLNVTYDDPITMRHLMNHQAGFEDKAAHLMTENPDEIIPLNELLSQKNNPPKQINKPGEVTAYSNYSTSLAGYIVERGSGEDFAEYMQTKVLDPLDAKYSTFRANYSDVETIIENKSIGYEPTKGTFKEVPPIYVNDEPAGALNTTIEDMGHFILAHLGSEDYALFNNDQTRQDMHKETFQEIDRPSVNAHGFWERRVNDQRVLEHGGNSLGFTTYLALVPEENFGFAILTNVANDHSGLRNDLVDLLIGEQDHQELMPSHNDEAVEGTYRPVSIESNFLKTLQILSNQDVTIEKNDAGGILMHTAVDSKPIQYTETEPLTYERVSEDVPFMEKVGLDQSNIYFNVDDEGYVKNMTFSTMNDYLPVHIMDSVNVNLIILGVSTIAFIVSLFSGLIQWIRRKKQVNKNIHYSTGAILLSVCGLIVIINTVILFTRFSMDPFESTESFTIHLWINWLFPLGFILSSVMIYKELANITSVRKGFRIFLLIISVAFIFFMFNFHLLGI